MGDVEIRIQCIEFAMKIKAHAISRGGMMDTPAVGFDPATVIDDATTYYEFVTNTGD